MNKIRLFASTRNNGSAQSGLARVSAAFVVLVGIVLLVMSGCAGDVTVPVPVPTAPKPKEPVKLPKLNIQLEISTGTVMQGGAVTLSATVSNTGEAPSLESALLVFYRSDDAVITPDIIGNGLVHNIEPSAVLAIEEAMHSGVGLDPVLYADFIERSLAADQNVSEAVDERASQNAREGIAGIILDPVINTKLVDPLAINQTSKTQTITIPSTADVGEFFYGACVVLIDFKCASKELAVTLAPVPDLVPGSPAAPVFDKLVYLASETVTVSMKVRNAGGADSTDGIVRLIREAGDDDEQIGESIALGRIAADATADFQTTFITAGTVVGVYNQEYYFVIDLVSNEPNNSNNTSGTGIIVLSEGNLVDGDNDNLIDIHNLDMLNNVRYNLAGTSYKLSDLDLGKKCGTGGTTDCAGYELMRDLDFTQSSSYEDNNVQSAWLPNRYNTADAINAGWIPIGRTGGVAYSTTFEGNSYSISNLYARSSNSGSDSIGLFGQVSHGTLRNLTVINGNVYGAGGQDTVGIVAGTVWTSAVLNCATRGGSANGDGYQYDRVGGLIGTTERSIIAASYSTANVHGATYSTANRRSATTSIKGRCDGCTTTSNATNIGGLVGTSNGDQIIASYATGSVHGANNQASQIGGLVGFVYRSWTRSARTVNLPQGVWVSSWGARSIFSSVNASYVTGNVYGGGGIGGMVTGGLIGSSQFANFTANYVTGNVDRGDYVHYFSTLVGNDGNRGVHVNDTYSFNSIIGTPHYIGIGAGGGNPLRNGSPNPNGVTRVGDLTASNVPFTWNNVPSQTAGAWVFDASYGAPALKYADYDGDGGFDYCAHFPAGACSSNRLLPNQPVLDQGGSIQSAYVIDTDLYPTVGLTVPAKLTLGDTDYFQITVKQAGQLTIESDSGINTQVTLYTSNGAALEYDDNDGKGNNFKISRAIARGVYYIRAYGYSSQAGPYTLNVTLSAN